MSKPYDIDDPRAKVWKCCACGWWGLKTWLLTMGNRLECPEVGCHSEDVFSYFEPSDENGEFIPHDYPENLEPTRVYVHW